MRSKRSHRIALLISGTIGLVAFSFIIIENLKIRSFENALAELVESKTNGEYKLVVEKSDINLRNLDFQLENLLIEKTKKNKSGTGIQLVHIPFIKANFGSLKSFFNVGQVTIEELIMAEPSIDIDTKSGHRTQFNIAHTLIKIFPAVESILERFDVQLLRISRGNIKIEKDRSELLHLKLIDFLITEWDMRQLTSDSRIQLNIQGQQVDLNRSSFTFSEVEYKYPEHYIIFKDFLFESADTITGSKISVDGKSVLINQLDYNELYQHQRFKLRKIEVLEPRFNGRIVTKKTKQTGSDHYVHPLVEILKQTFGEVDLDSAVIKDAQLDLTLAINEDSVKSVLDDIDIKLSSFKILKDSSQIQIEEISLDLRATELKLNDDVKLTCSNMTMVAHRNFTITDARLVTIKTGKEFAKCEKIALKDFKILHFIFDNKLLVNDIELENANIIITAEYLKLFPSFSGGSGRRVSPHINNLVLKNVNLNYYHDDTEVHLKGVDAMAHDIREFSVRINPHQVSTLKLKSINARLKNPDFNFHGETLDLNQRYASIQKIDFTRDKFHLTVDGLHAIPTFSPDSSGINFHKWEKVRVESLVARGEIPQANGSQNNVPTTISHLQIQRLTNDINYSTNHLSFQAKNLSGKGIHLNKKELYFDELLARVYEFKKEGKDHEIQIDSLNIDTKNKTATHYIKYEDKNLSASIPYLEMDKVDGTTDSKSISLLFAKDIEVYHTSGDSLAFMDSVFVFDLQLKGDEKPIVNEIEIFHPVINLGQKIADEQSTREQEGNSKEFDFVKKFKIHAARIGLQHKNITILGNLTGQLEKGNNHLTSDRLQLKNNKSTITISGLNVVKDSAFIEHINIDPSPLYYDKITEQEDVISGELINIKLKNFLLDSMVQTGSIHADSISLDDFSLHIKRDKRLADPLPLDKPITIDALLHKSKIFTEEIVIKNGNLTYEEVSAKTADTGRIELSKIEAVISKNRNKNHNAFFLKATTRLYNKAPVAVEYNTIDSSSFNLAVNIEPFDLTILNPMLVPLQSIEIKSGSLKNYELLINANHDLAEGEAAMTYEKLHLEIFKRNEPGTKNVGSEVFTLLADGVVLKHNKEKATATVKQPRIPQKSIFNYWVKSVIQGSLNVVRHGKRNRKG